MGFPASCARVKGDISCSVSFQNGQMTAYFRSFWRVALIKLNRRSSCQSMMMVVMIMMMNRRLSCQWWWWWWWLAIGEVREVAKVSLGGEGGGGPRHYWLKAGLSSHQRPIVNTSIVGVWLLIYKCFIAKIQRGGVSTMQGKGVTQGLCVLPMHLSQ